MAQGRMIRLVAAAFFIFSFSWLGGCIHPCLALAEEICECEESESEIEACKRRARNIFDQAPAEETGEAKEECARLLETCDCTFIATEEGKRACGIAR